MKIITNKIYLYFYNEYLIQTNNILFNEIDRLDRNPIFHVSLQLQQKCREGGSTSKRNLVRSYIEISGAENIGF
jgi:hypothetical protein